MSSIYVTSKKYRPSEEEVKKAAPALIERIEGILNLYAKLPLPYYIKNHKDDSYNKHIQRLLYLIEEKFDEMIEERECYNEKLRSKIT
ncbi:hypothetical protein HUT03_05060 [Candidatus Liberibacter africanus]|uniref:hypothetical protein n=1 Tax=Liberibacter africanus TaxID=34020 RepID=UPI001AE4339D|nr:hypothetical protein [Candidatus Liberibacter africanus]QTP64292.1 hypothetical protein HUT03_05060 [Candidatus Liberibacter africanus]